MPLYNYGCIVCDEKIEIQHKMNEKPVVKCPKCGTTMRKLIGGNTSIKFNGKWFSNNGEY